MAADAAGTDNFMNVVLVGASAAASLGSRVSFAF